MNVLDPGRLIETAGALLIVLALLALAGVALRHWRGRMGALPSHRLVLVETLALDGRHRLVRVRDGSTEHLLLLGPGNPTILETQAASEELQP